MNKSYFDELRKKALDLLNENSYSEISSNFNDIRLLIEELNVYRIELELQNQELLKYQSELEHTINMLQDLFEHAPIGYIIMNLDYTIEAINYTASQILGFDKELLLKINFAKLVSPEYQDEFYLHIRKLNDTDTQFVSSDIRCKCKNGFIDVRIISCVDKLYFKDRKVFRVALIDITKEIQYQKQIIEEAEKAKRSEKLKSIFLSNTSHEIRTPLNSIIGFSELICMQKNNDPKTQKYAEIILQSGKKMLELIDTILDLSKIDSGNMPINLKDVNIYNLLNKCIDDIKLKKDKNKDKKDIEIKSCISKKYENIIVRVDDHKIKQIVNNLLENAVKFTEKGKVEVSLSIKEKLMTISISDTGIGIDKEYIDKIFERFFQIKNDFTKATNGVGLGLSLVKEIVNLMNGKIFVDSIKGFGSTFTIQLPVEIVMPENTLTAKTSEPLRTEFSYHSLQKILIVEDNKINYQLMKVFLEKLNLQPINAPTAEKGIEMLKENFDIKMVFMDIKLPGMNGIDAIRKIRLFDKSTPIIVLSACCMDEEERLALEAGANKYLPKPLNFETLNDLINQYLK